MFYVLNGEPSACQPLRWPGSELFDLGALQCDEMFLRGLGSKCFALSPILCLCKVLPSSTSG